MRNVNSLHSSKRIQEKNKQKRQENYDKIYKLNCDGKVYEANIFEEKVGEKTVGEIISELEETKRNLLTEKSKHTHLKNKVGYFLRTYGADALEEVLAINPYNEYMLVQKDEEGFVKGISKITSEEDILPWQPTPNDAQLGFSKVEKNKIVEDHDRKWFIYRLM